MKFTAAAIAGFLNGEIEGNPETTVDTVAKIEEGRKGALSFLANPKYEHYLYTTQSSVVLVNKDFIPASKAFNPMSMIRSAAPMAPPMTKPAKAPSRILNQ